MRKLSLSLFGCMALVAFMGLGAPAYAEQHDPDCDAYGNVFGLYNVAIDTPDSHAPGAVSGVSGKGLACGTSIDSNIWGYEQGGSGSQFVRADVQVPPGVEINPGSNIPDGSYVGSAQVDVLTWYGLSWSVAPWSETDNQVAQMSDVDVNEGDCAGQGAVACYYGDSALGHNYNWVTESGGRYTLTIGEFHGILGSPAGLSEIDYFTLCDYAGAPGTTDCGNSSDPWLQKNGSRTQIGCEGGNGLYRVTATNRNGETTEPENSCVNWFNLGVRVPPSQGQGPGGLPDIAVRP